MPHPLLIFSQSDSLIQIVGINSYTEWQTVQIQISWLLKKPTDLDLHCLQKQGIYRFSRTRVNSAAVHQYCHILLHVWTDISCPRDMAQYLDIKTTNPSSTFFMQIPKERAASILFQYMYLAFCMIILKDDVF